MQLAFAALGKVFGALGLGGGAGAASAAGGAAASGAAAGASTGLTIAQGFSTAIQALATLGAGAAAAQESRSLADQADLQEGQEQVESAQRQTQMKRSLLQVLGENEVTFAGAGIDISSGIAQSAASAAKERAASELSIDRRDSDFRRALYRARASGLRRRASSQMTGGLLGALGAAADFGIQTFERGI